MRAAVEGTIGFGNVPRRCDRFSECDIEKTTPNGKKNLSA
jgi:hypothetical protein